MDPNKRTTTIPVPGSNDGPVVIRTAGPADERALERLAQLDSHVPLDASVLVAEVAGELRAARSMRSGETIADPFHHTAHLRDLLAVRGAQIAPQPGRKRWFAIRPPWRYARAAAR